MFYDVSSYHMFTHVMHCITWVNNMQLVFVLVICVGHTAWSRPWRAIDFQCNIIVQLWLNISQRMLSKTQQPVVKLPMKNLRPNCVGVKIWKCKYWMRSWLGEDIGVVAQVFDILKAGQKYGSVGNLSWKCQINQCWWKHLRSSMQHYSTNG